MIVIILWVIYITVIATDVYTQLQLTVQIITNVPDNEVQTELQLFYVNCFPKIACMINIA
jgi:hypothetical protein